MKTTIRGGLPVQIEYNVEGGEVMDWKITHIHNHPVKNDAGIHSRLSCKEISRISEECINHYEASL